MTDAGPGSRAIVYGSHGADGIGHYFNIINDNGTIRIIDGQTHQVVNLGDFQDFSILPTADGDGVAITSDMLSPHLAEVGGAGNHPYGIYKDAPYHGKVSNSVKNKAPIDGQAALDNSISIGPNTTRRVGVSCGEIVVLDETLPGEYHGHVRSWDELNPQMQSALRKAGLVDKKGRIIP